MPPINEKSSEERLDLLIEVTKANTEVTKYFTEASVKQNELLEGINSKLSKLVDYTEKDGVGISKKISDERNFLTKELTERFNTFFWRILGILTFIGAIISAIYYMIAFPSISELQKETKELNKQIIQQNETIKEQIKELHKVDKNKDEEKWKK